jgi:hypothetical protein
VVPRAWVPGSGPTPTKYLLAAALPSHTPSQSGAGVTAEFKLGGQRSSPPPVRFWEQTARVATSSGAVATSWSSPSLPHESGAAVVYRDANGRAVWSEPAAQSGDTLEGRAS